MAKRVSRDKMLREAMRKVRDVGLVREWLAEMPEDLTIGEVIRAWLDRPGNELVVWGVFRNSRSTTLQQGFEARCLSCQELLSQLSARGLPVYARRTDGSLLPCIVMVCDDKECESKILAKAGEGKI